MHELSIALAVVETVAERLLGETLDGKSPPRVESVTLAVGALSGVDCGALRFAFPEATAGTALAGATLEIEEIGLVAFCPSCDREQAIPNVRRLRCPVCRTPTPRIVRGRELEILRLAVVGP